MIIRNQRGVTLVELIVAITIFVVLALAAGLLYSTSLKLFIQNKVTEELQREGDATLAHMSRNLKDATEFDSVNSNLSTNPNTLTVKLSSGQTRRYYVTGSQLHYINESAQDSNLLAGGTTVTSLTFAQTSNTSNQLTAVKVQMTLSRTKNTVTTTLNLGSTITPRPQ